MFERILVASDLSAASDQLVRCVAGWRRFGASRALLLHALCMRHYRDMRPVVEPLIEPRLQAQAEMLRRAGLEVATEVLPGKACEEILAAAGRFRAGLIAMATRSGSLIHDLLVGSTVLEVLGRTGTPVLALQARDEDPHWTCCRETGAWIGAHILHPTDFSDTAELAFRLVKALAARGAEQVTLLHVQPARRPSPGAAPAGHDDIDEARLRRMLSELQAESQARAETLLASGNPGEEIIRCAGLKGATLIVMGARGKGLVSEVLLGSESHHVIRHAPVPVLLAPGHVASRGLPRQEAGAEEKETQDEHR
jgi:nucleotide-binding universal stress UspA family protein